MLDYLLNSSGFYDCEIFMEPFPATNSSNKLIKVALRL